MSGELAQSLVEVGIKLEQEDVIILPLNLEELIALESCLNVKDATWNHVHPTAQCNDFGPILNSDYGNVLFHQSNI